MCSYIVTAWNLRSETSYTFGPFSSWEAADRWIGLKMENTITSSWESINIECLNPPATCGTGKEMSTSPC